MVNRDLDRYVISFKKGSDEAFDVIYEETKKIVYLSIYPIVKSNSITEDIMQDVYLKAIQSLDSYKIGTNFKAWISKIAHNLAINEYNRNKKIDSLDEYEDYEIADKQEDNSLLDTAYEVLNRNPVKNEKEIFTYRIMFNLKYTEIGEILNLPKSTVFDIYNRAIEKIKKSIYMII